jgi:hypothetical protein
MVRKRKTIGAIRRINVVIGIVKIITKELGSA